MSSRKVLSDMVVPDSLAARFLETASPESHIGLRQSRLVEPQARSRFYQRIIPDNDFGFHRRRLRILCPYHRRCSPQGSQGAYP